MGTYNTYFAFVVLSDVLYPEKGTENICVICTLPIKTIFLLQHNTVLW